MPYKGTIRSRTGLKSGYDTGWDLISFISTVTGASCRVLQLLPSKGYSHLLAPGMHLRIVNSPQAKVPVRPLHFLHWSNANGIVLYF